MDTSMRLCRQTSAAEATELPEVPRVLEKAFRVYFHHPVDGILQHFVCQNKQKQRRHLHSTQRTSHQLKSSSKDINSTNKAPVIPLMRLDTADECLRSNLYSPVYNQTRRGLI
ncbi:hypothetical protein BaRGS_00018400 [Batillaria attramentaria]|uniref:Uncharacterized protein n=1 Tax=Batillaria attramentaria TaxID=370345 RepID=A0ABD0KT21_9CAEN